MAAQSLRAGLAMAAAASGATARQVRCLEVLEGPEWLAMVGVAKLA